MKYAFVSVSAEGARLGRRVKSRLGTDITLYERTPVSPETEAVQFHRTADLTARIFGIYDGILYIMASGIAVRSAVSTAFCRSRFRRWQISYRPII